MSFERHESSQVNGVFAETIIYQLLQFKIKLLFWSLLTPCTCIDVHVCSKEVMANDPRIRLDPRHIRIHSRQEVQLFHVTGQSPAGALRKRSVCRRGKPYIFCSSSERMRGDPSKHLLFTLRLEEMLVLSIAAMHVLGGRKCHPFQVKSHIIY